MQICERILTKCGSSSSSPAGKSLLPAVLGVVVDQQLLAASRQLLFPAASPSKTPSSSGQMAHTASLLLSPPKRPLCSSSSPARTAMVLSPPSASKAKRPLAALQCCPNSSSSSHNALSSISQHHYQQQHQQHLHSAAGKAVAAAAAGGGENEQPLGPGPAAKRLEVARGCPSSAPKPHQPVTPLIPQPEPLAAATLGGSARHTPAAGGRSAASAAGAAASSGSPAGQAAAAAAAAAAGHAPRLLLEERDDDGRLASDQLPSPCAILDAPPALMASAAAAAAAAAQGAGHAAAAALEAHTQHQQQQHQQQHEGMTPQHAHHSALQHLMSGKKLDGRYDVPVSLGYLDALPDHQPSLGSGQLDVIVGPMFAGKTTALLNQLRKVVAGRPFLCVKSSKDRRYSDHWIVTHGGGCVRCVPFASLAEFKAHMGLRWHKVQVIAIDEAQFFPDLVEFCQEAVDHDGKHVIVAGLSGDFRRRRFGQVLDLLPLADSVQQLKSVCAVCGGKHGAGLFSLRKVGTGPQEVVGGDEAYLATCRRCYLEHGGQLQ